MKPAAWMAWVLLIVTVQGCQPKQPIVAGDLVPPPTNYAGRLPTTSSLIEQYNANAHPLDRIWATTAVTARFIDEKGKPRREDGDGLFIYTRPRNLAITLGKLGNNVIWAGSNDESYWLFDFQGKGAAWFGRHERVGEACSKPLPLPIDMNDLPLLLGIAPVEDIEVDSDQPAALDDDGYVVLSASDGGYRMYLHPRTARPARVDLLDGEGEPVIIAMLSGEKRVEVQGIPYDVWPVFPARVELYVLDQDASMTIKFDNLTDGRRLDKINPRVFDLAALMKMHEPDRVDDLDEGCE